VIHKEIPIDYRSLSIKCSLSPTAHLSQYQHTRSRYHRVRQYVRSMTRAHRVRVRVRVQKFLNFKHFTGSGSGPAKTLNRPGPGRVRVQQILISRVRVRVRVQKFLDPMGSVNDTIYLLISLDITIKTSSSSTAVKKSKLA
jgi:hypothetical protein